jgi:hypothetical protein
VVKKSFGPVVALVLVGLWIGCGQQVNVPESSGPAPTAIHPNGKALDPVTAGTISGTIKLDGAPPKPRNINMAGVSSCAKEHAENPAQTEDVVPGDDGTLQNVVVYLQGDFSAYEFDIPQTAVTLDQKGCQYQPHVLALMTYQPLVITTSDKVEHNIHPVPKNNRQWNFTEPPGAPASQQSFAHPEVAIPVKCNLHAWMKSYIAVLDSPYFAVTGKDGSFALHNVPPGNYTVTAWQETYGTVQQNVVLAAKESKSITLRFKASGS